MRLDEVLFNVPCPIFWKDLSGNFLGCNKLFLPLSGFKNINQLIGKTDAELPWRDHKDEYQQDDQYIIKTGETITRIEQITTTSSEIISETTKTPLMQDGTITGILGICMDITDKKEKERLEIENRIHQIELKSQQVFKECMDNIQNMLQQAKFKLLQIKVGSTAEITTQTHEIKLTKREKEVLYFLSLGKSPKEIAQTLSTLQNHKVASATIGGLINKQLYPKFNVFNISQLLEKASMLNLIPFIHESLINERPE